MEESITTEFIIKNAVIAARLSKKIGGRLSAHGISLTEFLLMQYLAKKDNQPQSRIELANYLGLSASGVTRLLNPMHKIHLIEKVENKRDARQSMVKLSKAGVRIFNEAFVSFKYACDEVLGIIPKSQQEKTVELFAKLLI